MHKDSQVHHRREVVAPLRRRPPFAASFFWASAHACNSWDGASPAGRSRRARKFFMKADPHFLVLIHSKPAFSNADRRSAGKASGPRLRTAATHPPKRGLSLYFFGTCPLPCSST